jgi:lactobin A/cerein 7B family class IIb bacteriocin
MEQSVNKNRDLNKNINMKDLTKKEMSNISGGWLPIIIGICKGIGWAAGVYASACALAYGAGYAYGQAKCQ